MEIKLINNSVLITYNMGLNYTALKNFKQQKSPIIKLDFLKLIKKFI